MRGPTTTLSRAEATSLEIARAPPASPVLGLTPAIAPAPHADTFFGSALATAGHWSGVAREAVLSGDGASSEARRPFVTVEAAALLAAARDSTFDEENDTVDDAATFLAPIIESGAVAPRNAALAAPLAPLVDERLPPFVRERNRAAMREQVRRRRN